MFKLQIDWELAFERGMSIILGLCVILLVTVIPAFIFIVPGFVALIFLVGIPFAISKR